jgi:hypothetical protein
MDDASTSTHRTATPVPRRATRARAARIVALVLAGAALAPAVALGTASPSQAATSMITVPGGTGPVHYAVVTVSGTTTRALQLDGTRCVPVRAGDAVTYKYRGGSVHRCTEPPVLRAGHVRRPGGHRRLVRDPDVERALRGDRRRHQAGVQGLMADHLTARAVRPRTAAAPAGSGRRRRPPPRSR